VNRGTWVGLLVVAGVARASDAPSLRLLYDQHRWFELRAAIKGKDAPRYTRVRLPPRSMTRKRRRSISAGRSSWSPIPIMPKRHTRSFSGKYREAVQQLDQVLRIKSGNPDGVNARALFAAWSRHRDQSIRGLKPTSIHGQVSKDGVRLPVSIHGKAVHWALDTGANFSVISESEARMLGIAIDESSATIADSVGGTTRMRTAVVDELAVGEVPPTVTLTDSQDAPQE